MPERRNSPRLSPQAKLLNALVLVAATMMLPVSTVCSASDSAVDPRKIYGNKAPRWLQAIGKLQVPGSTYENGRRAHLLEDCSATLVTGRQGGKADIIITAWHCLANYNDLSRPIQFVLVAGQKQEIEREAFRLADGGGMHADWAILRLKTPIAAADVTALLIHPDRATAVHTISMAGYSRDLALGGHGKQLTYHPDCLITVAGTNVDDSNCVAYKGASGGAVVQLSGTGIPWFSGVISQGDSVGLSRFVPVDVFRNAINLHIR